MQHALLLLVLLGAPALLAGTADEARPTCNSQTRGQFWPATADRDPGAARDAARSGELRVCTREGWRYGWRQVTVRWTDLQKAAPEKKTPGKVL